MTNEFNLSEKIIKQLNWETGLRAYSERDVKEAIRLLKEGLGDLTFSKKTTLEYNDDIIDLIDKIFGDELTK